MTEVFHGFFYSAVLISAYISTFEKCKDFTSFKDKFDVLHIFIVISCAFLPFYISNIISLTFHDSNPYFSPTGVFLW